MERDPRAYLWDAREAADFIRVFTAGADFAAYRPHVTAWKPPSPPPRRPGTR